MKNKIDRTQTGTKTLSTRAIAMVLCCVMLLTAIGSGTMMTSFAAFKADADAAAAVESADAVSETETAQADTFDVDSSAVPGLITRTKDAIASLGANIDAASTGFSTNLWLKVKGSWDGWEDHWIEPSTSATFDFTSLTANTDYEFSLNVNESNKDYYFNDGSTLNVSNGSNYTWNTATTGNNKFHVVNPCTFKLTFTWEGNGTSVKLAVSDVSAGSSSDTIYVMGPNFGGWDYSNVTSNNNSLTYDSSGLYKIEHTVGSNANDDMFRFYDKKNDTHYSPTTDSQVNLSTSGASSKSGVQNSYRNQVFSFKNFKAGDRVILWLDTTNKKTWATYATTDYYLTGYINGSDYDSTGHKFTGSDDSYTYTLESTAAAQYLTITDSSGTTYHPGSHPAANGAAYTTTDSSPKADKKWGITSGAKGKSITFTWRPTSKTLSWTISSGGNITVYAKDGAAPINWGNKTQPGATSLYGYKGNYAYNYGIIGTTTATSAGVTFSSVDCDIVAGGTSGSKYQQGSVPVGQTVEVTTTIGSDYSSKYYVAGWSVNGITYKNGEDTVGVNPSSTTSYSFKYTLPSDTEDMLKDVNGDPVLEITPIYYLKSKTNTVTFYLEGYSDVASTWGNTPYCYPFYGNLSGYQNTFGVYPGQPMVNVGGQISIEIPIYTVPISGTVTSTVIKGVTVSNGYADHVHRNLVYGWTTGSGGSGDDKDHMQTYDYDDFYKIYEERLDGSDYHPNAIFFRIKEKTTKYNRSTYGGGSTGGQLHTGTSDIDISSIATSGNGWELMKDRHDRNVNIFGDYEKVSSVTPSSATADTANALYVVSTGYNANIAGDYGTMWKIYDGNGKLITKDATNSRYGIPPSLLNLRGSASGYSSTSVTYPSANRSVVGVGSYTDSNDKYESIYKTLQSSTYTNKIVYITYEKDTQDTRNTATGEGAYRVDGKWFYTHASDNVTSTIGIEYYDKGTGKWVADTVESTSTGLGNTTKAKAVFDSGSYASSLKQTTSSSKLISVNGSWSFTADEFGSDNTYAFSGWYLKYDDTYEQVTGSTNKGTINATANYQLIARYVPLATSSLVITHKLDPESTGTGTAGMTVTYGGVAQTVNVVDGVARANVNVSYAGNNIVVTLTTTPANDGKVTKFTDDAQISPTPTGGTVPGEESEAVTKTLTFSDHDVYNSDGTSLNITQLDYMSKIDATPHYYEFTYTFTDRGGATKTYTSRGEISEAHYADYVSGNHVISDDFVKSRAPFESNFLKTLKLGDISKNYDNNNYTFKASATYTATSYTPIYDVKIKLPYRYYDTTDTIPRGYKAYNAKDDDYVEKPVPFTLKANYDGFVTIGATETKAGSQDNVSKSTVPNHTDNDFITAPNTLDNGTKYFKYWEIKRLADSDAAQATAPVVSRIYYPDLHYRIYCDSYVEAVYTDNEAEYWINVHNNGNTDVSCSVLYLESSRNQWNNGSGTTNASADVAADKIYNDFMFSYRLGEKEYITANEAEIGVVLERVYYNNGTSNVWAVGDSSVTNMDSYKSTYGDTESNRRTMISNYLSGTSNTFTGCVRQIWKNSDLNNKNYTEQNYSVYSQYGQTVEDHSITFTTDSKNDNYVYRAWAYIIDKTDVNKVYVSDQPAYFSMNYIAAQNYSE